MSYTIDQSDEDAIVFSGHEQGIADSPYQGISDMRNVNIISIPQEASVNFETAQVSQPVIAGGSVTSASNVTHYCTYTGAANLENNMAINFTAESGLNVTANITTTYWVTNVGGAGAGTFKLSSTYPSSVSIVAVTNGTGTFTVYNVSKAGVSADPVDFAYDNIDNSHFMLDGVGQLWTNTELTGTNNYWTFCGVSGTSDLVTNQQGMVYYSPSNGASASRFIFIFRNSSIDFLDLSDFSWAFGWKPSDGSTSNAAPYLETATIYHRAILGPDNKVYYCDGNWISRFYQESATVPFVPGTPSTYVADDTSVLPFNDTALSLAFLGNNLLIGGQKNVIYPWDTFSQLPQFPIFLPESNCVQLVTVGGNTYIFTGNRGRIYVTNGTQAQLYKKMPDHLSGTVEPYYIWGRACSQKNQLYFSVMATTNSGSTNANYGGIWAIDLDAKYGYGNYTSGPLRLTNKLSYGTYAGFATAMIPNFSSDPGGTGLYMGWTDGGTGYGIDGTVSTPYTSSQAYVDYDLIPPGTTLIPKVFKTVEYKLTVPMVTGESISIYYRLKFNDSYTLIFTDNVNGNYSNYHPVNFDNSQWIQLRAVLNSTASSPSYTRLREIRIK